jgi:hypothetical protein
MQRHSRGTGISTGEASIDDAFRPRPWLSFLLDLGVIATFAVAMLALIAMVNPALAGGPANAPSAERATISSCP